MLRLDPVTLIGGPHDGVVTNHTLVIEHDGYITNLSYPLGTRARPLGGYYYQGDGTATWRAYAGR
ncbi:MAG TPA: hypothetical protein VGS17_06040 [Candidatus Limnocylindria bacterium]|nr:hypothetical protein [Candidatus Limnocylindria bacterium]